MIIYVDLTETSQEGGWFMPVDELGDDSEEGEMRMKLLTILARNEWCVTIGGQVQFHLECVMHTDNAPLCH